MGHPSHELGRSAEDAVADWLGGLGWTVLARRHRDRDGGEVDLLAVDPGFVLVAVEVRARRSGRAGSAAESVDRRRTARLARTLSAYARTERRPHTGLRIDLVVVEPMAGPANRWRLRRLPDIGSG